MCPVTRDEWARRRPPASLSGPSGPQGFSPGPQRVPSGPQLSSHEPLILFGPSGNTMRPSGGTVCRGSANRADRRAPPSAVTRLCAAGCQQGTPLSTPMSAGHAADGAARRVIN